MNLLLQPILESISCIERDGIPHKEIVIRAKLMQAVFDLPAKSAATCTKQFNGEYGCFYCLHKGEIYNRARIYPPQATTDFVLRSSSQMKAWAMEAERCGKSQFGVKGKSLLYDYLEFPQCIPIDYMHSILEGVFKSLMQFWFN